MSTTALVSHFTSLHKACPLSELSSSLIEVNRVCGSVGGGGVCYSGDSVGSVAVYFCDDGYTLQGGSTRQCLSTGFWNGTTPHCIETDGMIHTCMVLCVHYP